MIIKNKVLTDFDGVPMRTPDGRTVWTVAHVLMNAAVQPSDPNKPPRTEDEHLKRHAVARQLHGVAEDGDIDIPVDMVAELKADICRLFGSMVVGTVVPILEGKPH
jgi:hypothetical protein